MGQKEDSSLIQVKVYNTSFGQFQLKSTYYGHDSKARAVAFLQDGTAVSAGGDQNAIHFWSTAHLEGEQMSVIKGIGRVVHGVGINDDQQIGIGNHKELINQDSTITLQRMFDLPSMSLKWIPLSDNQSFHRALPTLGDRSLGRSGGGDLLLFTPDQPEGLQIRDYEWYDAITFGFTPKGFVIVGAHDGKVRRITLNKARTDRTGPDRYLEGHAARVLDHAASSKWLVTAGTDQIIRLWFMQDVEKNVTTTLEPALNLFVGTDDEWVIWSKSGYYNASRKGDSRFGYHVNRGADKEAIFIPGHRFIKSFFRPDIIDAIVEQGSEEQAFKELRKQNVKVSKVNVAKILPPILEMEQNGILLAQSRDQVTFKFTVESLDSRNPVTRIWVVVNDRDVTDIPRKDWKRESPQSMKISIKISLPLQAGPNHFKILAQNKTTSSIPFLKDIDGPDVSEASVAARGTANAASPQPGADLGDQSQVPVNGTLYLLAIGVSDLKWEKGGYESLKYADEDAISIYNAFAKSRFVEILDEKGAMKNGAFKSIEPCILLNKEATQEAILDAIKKITDQIQKHHQANPAQRDVLFVFLSGHGVRSYDEAELYFWNYDLDFDNIGNTGLSFIELGKKMTSLPADIILATDACKSGMAGSNVVKGIDPNELAKQIYAINERGMYILSATRSGRNAIEANSLKHGIFTMTILNKLREVQPGGSVNMLGLIDYVQMGVHKYTQNLKNDYQTAVCRIYGDLLPLMIYKME
jgi:WD40 repeat protein